MLENIKAEAPSAILVGRRLLVVSPVLPRQTSGGEVVLYRHLSRLPNVEITVALADEQHIDIGQPLDITAPPRVLTTLQCGLERLTRTRFAPWARAIRWALPARYVVPCNLRALRRHISIRQPDALLTVAHGDWAWLALELAEEFDLPLATFFHDWFPDYLAVPGWIQPYLNAKFRRLYQRSRTAFVVSEELKRELGDHRGAVVLHPIPSGVQPVADTVLFPQESRKVIVVGYLGNLSGNYGRLILRLWKVLARKTGITLRVWGPSPDWLIEFQKTCCTSHLYGGFAPVLEKVLLSVDLLLVVASFAPEDAKMMRTNFPSKLIEYCRFGKPIIIWGPDYSSGVEWAKRHGAALIVTEDTPESVVAAIHNLTRQPEEWRRLAMAAQDAARTLFDPVRLQTQFVSGLAHAIGLSPRRF